MDQLTLLRGQNHLVLTQALGVSERRAVLRYFDLLLAAKEFQPAGVGSGGSRVIAPEVRSDLVRWLDLAEIAEMGPVRKLLEEIRIKANRELFLGLDSFEGHFAYYPEGAFYRRHLDRFRDDDRRALSFALYLNEEWTADDGGELVLYLPSGPHAILPLAGTLVVFLSDEVEHEVLPAKRPRKSFTGWFRRR